MIKIICVGKIKEEYLKKALEEYIKRLGKYTKIEIIEIPDYTKDIPLLNMEHEARDILKYIDDKDYIISLTIEGVELNSLEFSKKITDTLIFNPNITFIIGGSYGLAAKIKNISNYKLSFSRLTFPHQLFRVILLEQIYRAFKISNNETYHK